MGPARRLTGRRELARRLFLFVAEQAAGAAVDEVHLRTRRAMQQLERSLCRASGVFLQPSLDLHPGPGTLIKHMRHWKAGSAFSSRKTTCRVRPSMRLI
uniref:Uncharacterized protein n=1 Tax=Rhodopseudomonas palustris (strain ATCC BAA-98 / CGA009) TaxID=258594 RepID=Q6N333_RHOPA|nr:hypothetical protein RPA3862 [Rhodopseudomonas palustris CGA009]